MPQALSLLCLIQFWKNPAHILLGRRCAAVAAAALSPSRPSHQVTARVALIGRLPPSGKYPSLVRTAFRAANRRLACAINV